MYIASFSIVLCWVFSKGWPKPMYKAQLCISALKLKCNAKTTLLYMTCYSVQQMRNNAEISIEKLPHFLRYLRSKLTKSLVSDNFSENTRKAWHQVVTSYMTQETSIPRVLSCCPHQAAIKMSVYESKGVTSLPKIPHNSTKVHHFVYWLIRSRKILQIWPKAHRLCFFDTVICNMD